MPRIVFAPGKNYPMFDGCCAMFQKGCLIAPGKIPANTTTAEAVS
jgi:hypothetical protein